MALKVFVGSKDKVITTTGAEASPTTGVGFKPKVAIFSGSTQGSAGWGNANSRFFVGFAAVNAAGTMTYGTASYGSSNNAATAAAGRRLTVGGCGLWSSASGGEAVKFSINGNAFDSDGFTLNYAANNASAAKINYILLGGDDIFDATVLNWTKPTSDGSFSRTGVGFRPDAMLSIAPGAGATTVDTAYAGGNFSIGACDKFLSQWYNTVIITDGVNPSNTGTLQDTEDTLADFNLVFGSLGVITLTSFDADGFTANMTNNIGSADRVFSLCLQGPGITVGTFDKSTTTAGLPITQAVSNIRQKPVGYLLSSGMAAGVPASPAGARLGIGFTDNTSDAFAGVTDKDNVSPTVVHVGYESAHVFAKNNNDDTTSEAQTDHSSLDTNGFTTSIPVNDAVATTLFYMAFGSHQSNLPLAGVGN